jgi:protein phosphatase
MVSEDRVGELLVTAPTLEEAADRLIDEANAAGGRDNITVVLCRLDDVEGDISAEQPTTIDERSEPNAQASRSAVAVAPPPATSTRVSPRAERTVATARRPRRVSRPLAALLTLVIVLCLIGAGGYLASRQLYFIGTNQQGIVTIYRGFPYQLPGGLNLYETYVVSGVPASLVPTDRRNQFFNNQLRSQSDALSLVRQLELGRISQ